MTAPQSHFRYGRFDVAYLDANGVSGTRGAGCGLVNLHLRMTTHAAGKPEERKRVRIPLIVGTLSAEGAGFLATTQPVCRNLHCVEGNPPDSLEVTAAVPFAGIQEVDRLRGGGPVTLVWTLQAQIAGDSRNLTQDIVQTSSTSIKVEVGVDRWNALVTELGYEERVYTDSHVPVGGPSLPDDYADAGKHFKTAVNRHRNGDWEGTVVSCRGVLDSLTALSGTKRPPEKDLYSTSLSMAERLEYVRFAVRHSTHPGAHGVPGSVGPGEARLVLETTASILRFHIQSLP